MRVLFLCALLLPATLWAQRGKRPRARLVEVPAPPIIYVTVDRPAEFRGGRPVDWISGHLRYPEPEHRAGVTGLTWVRFRIDSTGLVQAVAVGRTSGSAALDSEACRVVRAMPPWKPASISGRRARQQMQIPLRFGIE